MYAPPSRWDKTTYHPLTYSFVIRNSPSKMSAEERLKQVQSHLTNSYPLGLLAGKVSIITGAGQGIGAETAKLFAREGARVVVADIDAGTCSITGWLNLPSQTRGPMLTSPQAKSNSVALEITASGGKAISVPGDVLNKDYIPRLIKAAADFGNGKIHILVNNAGYTWDGVIHKTTDEQWDAILAVHTKAPFMLIREAAKYFRVTDGEDRCIVNVGSTSGVFGNAGQANYATAKAGVEGLTKTIAKVCLSFCLPRTT